MSPSGEFLSNMPVVIRYVRCDLHVGEYHYV
jgi:hypothetical protein